MVRNGKCVCGHLRGEHTRYYGCVKCDCRRYQNAYNMTRKRTHKDD